MSQQPETPTRHYALGGLRVSSALRLPAAEIASSRVDVTIMGEVIADGAEPWLVTARRYQAAPGRWLFSPGDQLRVLVEHGRSIAYDAPLSMAESTIADCILQPALAALFHQRGLLALHASAVETPAGAVLLLGRRGAGKSTIAALLAAWGNPFIGDDVCPIDATSRPIVTGGFVFQKLSRDACHGAGYPYSPDAIIAGDDRARVHVRVREYPADAVPVAHIVLLERTPAGSPQIERLPELVATTTLVTHTYRRQYLRGLGTASQNLRMCAAVASRIPVARLCYEAGSVDSDTVARLVARHTDARCG